MKGVKVKKNGKRLIVRLKDGSKMEFRRVKKYKDGTWRYDSRDTAFESRWNDDGGTEGGYLESDLCRRAEQFINFLPDDLADNIESTLRTSVDGDGKEAQWETKVFVPDASEIFPDDGDNNFFAHPYKQLKYYKNTKNRVRLDEEGDIDWYWTASATSGYSTYACVVGDSGVAGSGGASNALRVPVCFHINSAKLSIRAKRDKSHDCRVGRKKRRSSIKITVRK